MACFRLGAASKVHSQREKKPVPPPSRRSVRLRNKSSLSQEMHVPIDVDLYEFDSTFVLPSRNNNGVSNQYEGKATTIEDGGSSSSMSLSSVASIPRQNTSFEHLSSFVASENEPPCVLKSFSLDPSCGLDEAGGGFKTDVASFRFCPAVFP
jgi:hypothetical protein